MRYQVPQFIEVEDKIIGPFTILQFVYIVGGGGMCFLAYKYVFFPVSLILIALIIPLSLALAFYKVNNKPFIDMLESAFVFYTKKNLYIWKKEERPVVKAEEKTKNAPEIFVPRLSQSKLKDLSWSLDINENLNPLTGEDGRNTK